MTTHLNAKYSQAVLERKQCLSLSESFVYNKIPNTNEMIAYLTNKMKDSVGIEYPENHFTKANLFNSNYNDITPRDFEKFFYLCELSGYKDSGRSMLKKILSDDIDFQTPIIIKGKNQIYWQIYGNLEMMTYRVLGIFPVVIEIPINANIVP